MSGANKVKLPCDFSDLWPKIQRTLADAKSSLAEQDCDAALSLLHLAVSYSRDHQRRRSKSSKIFAGLQDFINYSTSKEEKERITTKTLPFIIDSALNIEACKPASGLNYSVQGKHDIQVLPWDFVTSLVACAFLCLLPPHDVRVAADFNTNSYELFFASMRSGTSRMALAAADAKLRMILNFFDCASIRASPSSDVHGCLPHNSNAEEPITYHRLVQHKPRTLEQWYCSEELLCHFDVSDPGSVIEDFPECLQVDFANEYIGGGVLQSGIVQEEIMFSASPQLQACMFFMPCMKDNEAIQVHSHERFSRYRGYAGALRFLGKIEQPVKLHVTAIDALPYFGDSSGQYTKECILRDLNKAFIGFSQAGDTADRAISGCIPKLPIATGNWGCGVFGGDPQLKSLLQWIAASACSTSSIKYCTFAHPALAELRTVVDKILGARMTAGALLQMLVPLCRRYQQMITRPLHNPDDDESSKSIFKLLLAAL